jgi:hypothetical protein
VVKLTPGNSTRNTDKGKRRMTEPYSQTLRELALGKLAYDEFRLRQKILPRKWDELTVDEKQIWAKVALRVLKNAAHV